MNEDDPDFMQHVQAKIEGEEEIAMIGVQAPVVMWGNLLADEEIGVMRNLAAFVWLISFAGICCVSAIHPLWRPFYLGYALLGAVCALSTWRGYRQRRDRLQHIKSFLPRAQTDG